MATTLSPRALQRAAIKGRKAAILQAMAAVEAGAVRLRLRYTVALIQAITQVWLAHPEGPMPYPSQELLARMIGVTPETVSRQVVALERAGLIAVYRTCARPGGPGGRLVRRTNRYQFLDRKAMALKACPLRYRRSSRLDDIGVARPLDRGAVPAPPPSRPATEAPQVVDPPPVEAPEAPEGMVDGRQALAGVRAVLAQARRTTR